MANFLIQNCGSGGQLVVDPGVNTISIGNVYYIVFTGETNSGCFEVIEESANPIEEVISSVEEYNNCLSCYQSQNWSFLFFSCDFEELGGPINSNQLNEWPVGKFYKICTPFFLEFSPNECLCFYSLLAIEESYEEVPFEILGPFNDCNCANIIKTANTPYEVCLVCCPCESGSTITSVPVLHPTFTDLYGNSVVQGNAVLIGGNGLNS